MRGRQKKEAAHRPGDDSRAGRVAGSFSPARAEGREARPHAGMAEPCGGTPAPAADSEVSLDWARNRMPEEIDGWG